MAMCELVWYILYYALLKLIIVTLVVLLPDGDFIGTPVTYSGVYVILISNFLYMKIHILYH